MNHHTRKIIIFIYWICVAAYIAACTHCFALSPSTDRTIQKNGNLVIDSTYENQGYVLVHGKETDQKLKLKIINHQKDMIYDINSDGDWEIIPLQSGNGSYKFQLYQQRTGKQYAKTGELSVTANMEDENIVFLQPNQYVNFNEQTPAVLEANNLCDGMTDPNTIYQTIKHYINTHMKYDYLKSYTVNKKGHLPDIDSAWENKMGICQDIAAITVAMLRSQQVPAKLIIGTFRDRNGSDHPHAWVSVLINDQEIRYDPTAEILRTTGGTYTEERVY